jgi:hypothetical protein
MPNLITIQYPKPTDDVEFQEIIRDLFAQHWKNDNTIIYGRSGQRQNGVDVFGNPNNSSQNFGIQCKVRKGKQLTKTEIENEVNEAKNFTPKLHTFIFATTSDRDKGVQDLIISISNREKENGGFDVQIKFWEDIVSLFAEYPKIAKKYYSEFWGEQRRGKIDYDVFEEHPSEITEKSPLLVGCLLDLSKAMILDTVAEMEKPVKFDHFINQLVFRISAFCKSEEAEEVLDKLFLFLYGYGFGDLKRQAFQFLGKIGIATPKISASLIPDNRVRNIFGETAIKYSLPLTPSLSILNNNWSFYQKSIESQIVDIGIKNSCLYEGLSIIHEEYHKQLQRSFFKYPLLFLITTGKYDDSTAEDLIRITSEIKKMNIQIACILISKHDLLTKHKLYEEKNDNWPKEIKLLFDISSEFPQSSRFYSEILKSAKENDWSVPKSPKLFFQLNQTEMVNELIDLIFHPLQEH